MRDNEGQERRKLSSVPLCAALLPQQSGSVHSPSLFQGTQCPVRDSTLYLPDKSLAWVVAFSTSLGEAPQVQNRGWHLTSPRKPVLRYLREVRESAWTLSLTNQYCLTAALASCFTWSLDGLVVSQEEGWGREYIRQICLNFQNQDLEEEDAEEKMLEACLARILSPSLMA